MENRPAAAYTLALVGVALQGVAALSIAYMIVFFSRFTSSVGNIVPENLMPWMMGRWLNGYPFTLHPLWSIIWLAWAVVIVALGIYGALLMNNSNAARVRMGSTVVLVASIIAVPTMWGVMIGSLLMFVGSLLGLTWVPLRTQTT